MKKLLIFGLMLLTMALLTNCATIMHGSKQSITVTSDPPGKDIVEQGNTIGTTPATLKLTRSQDHVLLIGDEKTVIINKKTSGWIAGNILYGGLIGLVIDFATGGAYELTPDNINVKFL